MAAADIRKLSHSRSDESCRSTAPSAMSGFMSRRAKMIDFYTKVSLRGQRRRRRRPASHSEPHPSDHHQSCWCAARHRPESRWCSRCRSTSATRQRPARLPQDRDAGCEGISRSARHAWRSIFQDPEATASRFLLHACTCRSLGVQDRPRQIRDDLYARPRPIARPRGPADRGMARPNQQETPHTRSRSQAMNRGQLESPAG